MRNQNAVTREARGQIGINCNELAKSIIRPDLEIRKPQMNIRYDQVARLFFNPCGRAYYRPQMLSS